MIGKLVQAKTMVPRSMQMCDVLHEEQMMYKSPSTLDASTFALLHSPAKYSPAVSF